MGKSNFVLDKYSFFRACIYISELFVLFSIEQIPGFVPEFFGGRPILVLPLMISVCLAEGNYFSLIWGFLTGLILDLSFGGIIGIISVIMGILGYILGQLKDKLFEIKIFTFMFLCFIIEPLLIFLRFYINYVIKGIEYVDIIIYNHILPIALYTFLISPIIYLFNKPIAFFVRKKGGV